MNLRRSWKKEMDLLDKSVNRTHWTATPTDVNAYYSRNRNQISAYLVYIEYLTISIRNMDFKSKCYLLSK